MIIRELRFPVNHAGSMVIQEPVYKLLVAVGIAATFSLAFRLCWTTGTGTTHNITHRLRESGQH